MPRWTGAQLDTATFMQEMRNYMEVLERSNARHAIWDHTHFNFQIPNEVYGWIERSVNQPAQRIGMQKIGFVLGEDVMAQFSTMDCFEATQSVYTPRYFSDLKNALKWANAREEPTNPYNKEISLLVEKNAQKGTAKIQIEISLEQLPFYLKKVKDLFNHQTFVHANYQKFMLLTAREKEILLLIVQGLNSQAIADKLFSSKHTINTHRKNMLRKLECKSLTELLRYKLFL
jgi:DNA-binding CsgD family transcriptional regulator